MENTMVQKKLKDLTKTLWHEYIISPKNKDFKDFFKLLEKNFVSIGTGKHEFVINLKDYKKCLLNDQEAENIEFNIIDEWYGCIEVTPEVFVVYGTIWIREKADEYKSIFIEMDTRFTLIYKVIDEKITLVHMHRSVPNKEQATGEYYPTSITHQAEEAIALAYEFKQQSEKDLMTGIYNRHFLEVHINECLQARNYGYFYFFDLDNFKKANDTMGHIHGDAVILRLVEILNAIFPREAIIGRLGGDEFVVFDFMEQTIVHAEKKANKVLKLCKDNNPCSLGISKTDATAESFYSLYVKADYALYYAKKHNKGTFSWYEK
ncbi:MAG: GGDEF domain-containing protein [Clostridiales bacterium]